MRIGFLGLGNMGRPMARNLLELGHTVTVYNRTQGKAADLIAKGAKEAATVAEAVADVEVAITMLSDDAALAAVVSGPAGLLESLPSKSIHLCMSTIGVETSAGLAAAHADVGQGYVAAPVFGKASDAASRQIWIMAGGPEPQVNRCLPIFIALGRGLTRVGPKAALAHALKQGCNAVSSALQDAIPGILASCEKADVVPSDYLRVLNSTIFKIPLVDVAEEVVVRRAPEPEDLSLDLAAKEMLVALQESAEPSGPISPPARPIPPPARPIPPPAQPSAAPLKPAVVSHGKGKPKLENRAQDRPAPRNPDTRNAPGAKANLPPPPPPPPVRTGGPYVARDPGPAGGAKSPQLAPLAATGQGNPPNRFQPRTPFPTAVPVGKGVQPPLPVQARDAERAQRPESAGTVKIRRIDLPIAPPVVKKEQRYQGAAESRPLAPPPVMVPKPLPGRGQGHDRLGESASAGLSRATDSQVLGSSSAFAALEGDRQVMLDLNLTSHFEAANGRVWVWSQGKRYATSWRRLNEVELAFNHTLFLMIHRHVLLRPEAVLDLRNTFGGGAKALVAENLELDISRASARRLRMLLGL